MLSKVFMMGRWFIYSIVGAAALLGLMLYAGCTSDMGTAPPAEAGLLGSLPFYAGPASLEERIAGADVIARVRLRSVSSGAELRELSKDGALKHLAALEHRFEVLEYLKGSGGGELVAVVNELVDHETAERAAEAGAALLAGRDTRWDGREAIVFLWYGLQQRDRYLLGSIITEYGYFGDYYTIASPHDQAWLPAASAGDASSAAQKSSAAAASADAQRFLLDVPGAGPSGETAARGASSQAGSAPTITLAQMKAKIAEIEREAAAGGGSEAYRECLYHKYQWEREVRYFKEGMDGDYFYIRHDQTIASGLSTETLVYTSIDAGYARQKYGETEPSDYGRFVLKGRDEDLFHPRWPGVAKTARPLPEGEYKFYYVYQPKRYVPCDVLPEDELKRIEVFVQATAPIGTLHEAFFDPVAIGAAAGADATNGVLKPTTFTVGGVSTSLRSLKGQGGTVTLELSPAASLTGYALDFIALDGSVALSLDGGADTAAVETLTWTVEAQPWQAGDQIMLRIRDASADPPPTPTPTTSLP